MPAVDVPRRPDGAVDMLALAASGSNPATARQFRYLQAVAREAGLDPAALDEKAMQEFGVPVAHLTRRDASTLIDLIQTRNIYSE